MKNGDVLINCKVDAKKENKLAVYNPENKTFSNIFSCNPNLWTVEVT